MSKQSIEAACESRKPIWFEAASIQWDDDPEAVVAIETTPENLAVEKCIAAVQIEAAKYIGEISPVELETIQADAKIKAAELKAEAIENNRPSAWLDGRLNENQTAVKAKLAQAANSFFQERA